MLCQLSAAGSYTLTAAENPDAVFPPRTYIFSPVLPIPARAPALGSGAIVLHVSCRASAKVPIASSNRKQTNPDHQRTLRVLKAQHFESPGRFMFPPFFASEYKIKGNRVC
jgi:hypothetical protein